MADTQWQTLNTCYNYFVFNRHSLMELSQLWPAVPKATLVISSAGFYRPDIFHHCPTRIKTLKATGGIIASLLKKSQILQVTMSIITSVEGIS